MAVDGLPTHIARYEVLGVVGQGAMGVVYRARDPELDRLVALKTLRPELGLPVEARTRFTQEGRAAGRLSHPGIVAIHDVIDVAGTPYIVMECVDGRTLAELIASEGPLSPERVLPLIRQLCASLDYAHAQGVVHRDVKPGNVLVTGDGVTKLTDFGIARVAGGHATRTGVMLGTPAYMAPEQLRGAGPDAGSDRFALGVVVYELLTGVHPFQADDLATTLYRIVHTEPRPASEWTARVSPALSAVVARALAKEPAQRHGSAMALVDALEATSARTLATDPSPHDRTALALAETQSCTLPEGAVVRTPLRVAAVRHWTRRRLAYLGAVGILLGSVGGRMLGNRWSELGAVPAAPARATTRVTGSPVTPSIRVPQRPSTTATGPFTGTPAPNPAGASPIGGLGSILVTTNPSVEVSVDGVWRGRVAEHPLLVERIPVGPRRVTLRYRDREQEVRSTVRDGESWVVTYYFPDPQAASAPPKGRAPDRRDATEPLREAQRAFEKGSRDAKEAAREVQEKLKEASREIQDKVKEGSRDVLDKLRSVVGR